MKCKDYLVSGEVFSVEPSVKAKGLLTTRPFPETKDLPSYYKSEAYVSHTDGNKSLLEKVYQRVKKYNLRYKYNLIEKHTSGKALLDYGCGTGDFLSFMKQHSYAVKGYEPNEAARERAEKKIGQVSLLSDGLENLAPSSLDVVTLWHVLEHIPDLDKVTNELLSKVKPEGTLVLALPNYKSLDARFYKADWAAYDVPRHLWHFSPEAVASFFDPLGYEVVKKYPLWFDSVYVSLLSEKNKKSRFGFIRAIPLGLLSNLFALFDQNFSSIVYVLKKKP